MKKRYFSPKAEQMENRSLLSNLYPLDFSGPLPNGAYRDQRAVAMDFPMPGQTPTDVNVVLNSQSQYSIGGGLNYFVSAVGQYKLKEVKYTITGGAVSLQVWNKNVGDYTLTTGTTHSWVSPFADSDNYSFCWNETPELKTVKIEATYNDPASTKITKTFNYATVAPDVDNIGDNVFEAVGRGTQVGYNGTYWGLVQEGPTYFRANVLTFPSFGQLGFVQLVNSYHGQSIGTEQTVTVDYPAGMKILDWGGGEFDTFRTLNNYTKDADLQHTVTVGGVGSPASDSPSITGRKPVALSYTNVWKKFVENMTFDTYLDWQPAGGIHVEIAHLQWTVNATAVYNGSLVDPGVYTEFTDPTKWTVTADHPAGLNAWIVTGTEEQKILKWVKNSQQATLEYRIVIP